VDHFLNEDQQAIVDLAKQISREMVVPKRVYYDETEEYPLDIVETLAKSDFFALFVPEEFGGLGGGCYDLVLALEQIGYGCVGIATAYAASALGAYPIIVGGSQELKEKYLPKVATGELRAAFGLTESNAGSDAGGIQTTAVLDGDEWVLNGTKQWITNGGQAHIYTIIAITDPHKGARGASMFIVEFDDPGFSCGPKEKKMGIRCSATTELIMKDCRIPKDRIIGRRGTGFITVMKTLDKSRPGIASLGVGLAQAALDEAASYAKTRYQFGRPIISFQAVQHLLADMAIETEAARALLYVAARHIDAHPRDMSKASAMSKVKATDVAMKVTTDAVQVLAGYGFMREYPVEKMMRDAKILQIYEGTNQIQRNVIGQELNKEYNK
jgi:butyryl-CoA dehydrogenase